MKFWSKHGFTYCSIVAYCKDSAYFRKKGVCVSPTDILFTFETCNELYYSSFVMIIVSEDPLNISACMLAKDSPNRSMSHGDTCMQ